MNKFAAFAILALVAVALANSAPTEDQFENEVATQAILETDDPEETSLVVEKELEVFAPFCIQSRDFVFADVKQKAGTASSKAFSWIFAMTEEVAKEALKVNKDATERLSNQLANPDAEVEGDDVVAETQREVQEQGQPGAFFAAIQGTLKATADAVVKVAAQKFEKVKEFSDPKKAHEFAVYACDEVEYYENELRKQFDEYKTSSVPEEAKEKYERVKFEDVPCLTATRITRSNGICQFVKVAFAPVTQLVQIFKN